MSRRLRPLREKRPRTSLYRAAPHPLAPKLAPDGNGLIWLPDAAFATAFAQHASREDLAVLAAVQRPWSR